MTRGSIDSKVVDAELRRVLWPELKAIGFRRTGRTAWRDRPDCVQTVNIQSFNSYLADGIGATTFSFALNLGVFYPIIAEETPMSGFRGDPTRPAEWSCQARCHLAKGIVQSEWVHGRPPDRPEIWYVRPDGSNVEVVVRDATERIKSDGLPWLERLSDLREARRAFQEESNTNVERGKPGVTYHGDFYAIEALTIAIERSERP
jgi:hypothetical protein